MKTIPDDKTLHICHDRDDICKKGAFIFWEHLTYGVDAMEAAQFISNKLASGSA